MIMTSLRRILWLGALLCAATGGLQAADVPRGRPIEFSEPRDERGATNVQSLMPGRSTMLDQLEAEINRPFKSIIPGNSLNGMMMTTPHPLPPPTLPSARVREIMNKKRDQMYLTPEELLLPKSLEETYKTPELTPDGRDVNSLRPMERQMMKTLNADRARLATNQMNAILGPGYGNSDGAFSNPNGVNSSFGTANTLDRMRSVFGLDDESSRAREARDSRELFGLGQGFKQNPKLTPSELQHRDTLMQLHNPNYVAPVDGATPSAGLFSTPYVDSSFYDPPKPVAPPPSTTLPGSFSSAASSSTPYTPSYVPPPAPVQPPAPPRVPVSPFMNAPRRNF